MFFQSCAWVSKLLDKWGDIGLKIVKKWLKRRRKIAIFGQMWGTCPIIVCLVQGGKFKLSVWTVQNIWTPRHGYKSCYVILLLLQIGSTVVRFQCYLSPFLILYFFRHFCSRTTSYIIMSLSLMQVSKVTQCPRHFFETSGPCKNNAIPGSFNCQVFRN